MSEQDVSNEELLQDIEITAKETKAYSDIAFGYKALSELPENRGNNMYYFEFQKYLHLHKRCLAFYEKLCEIKEKRGI